jgi:hypothetical protein
MEYVAGGFQNGIDTFESRLAVSDKVKHHLPYNFLFNPNIL